MYFFVLFFCLLQLQTITLFLYTFLYYFDRFLHCVHFIIYTAAQSRKQVSFLGLHCCAVVIYICIVHIRWFWLVEKLGVCGVCLNICSFVLYWVVSILSVHVVPLFSCCFFHIISVARFCLPDHAFFVSQKFIERLSLEAPVIPSMTESQGKCNLCVHFMTESLRFF